MKDPVTSPEGLQLSTSRCRDTGHNHNLLLRAENQAYVPLCALDLHTHFNLLCFFTLIYYYMVMMIMIVFDVIVFFPLFYIANTNCT